MPFTLSHPLAAIALRRTRLPLAAMAAGSMAPDFPMFVRRGPSYTFTHSWAGVVTADLIVSVAAVLLWQFLVRDAIADLAPLPARSRLLATRHFGWRYWALVPLGAVVGSITHVVWDAFTHPGRWGSQHIAWLTPQHSHWMQAISTVVGGLGVAVWGVRELRRRAAVPRPSRSPQLARWLPASMILTVAIAGFATFIGTFDAGAHAAAIRAAEIGGLTSVAAVLGASLLWRCWPGPRDVRAH